MPTVYNKVTANGSTLIDLSSDTVAADKVLYGYTAHAASGAAITGSIASKTSSDLTASALTVTAPAGYYASDATKTLSDANLVAGNIKNGVSIFGVTGSYEGGGGSGITKETVEHTIASTAYAQTVPISGDVSKILFCHFYNTSVTYTTNNVVYEGFKTGPAGTYFQALKDNQSWVFYRTNSSGTTAFSYYSASGSSAFGTPGYVTISTNPKLAAGNVIVLEVYYAP